MKASRIVLLCIMVVLLVSCSKNDNVTQENILGTWILTDNSDTLYIVDKSNLYNSNQQMHYDHYDYQLIGDSISLGYSGRLYILVKPAKHKYYVNGNNLTIDLRNGCYGFESQVFNYTKH